MSNLLLQRFPAEVIGFLGTHLTRVKLFAGQELQAADQPVRQVYFPISAVLTVLHQGSPGQSMVVALIDASGMAGAGVLLGSDGTRTEVLLAGEAIRLEAGHLLGVFDRSAAVRQLLLGWLQVLMTQVVHAAACQRFHDREQRLCMRLAQLAQGRPGHEVALTQQQLGVLLGLRRESVNALLGELLAQGLIAQRRGRLMLREPDAIAHRACACHQAWQQAQAQARLAPP